MVCLLSLLSSCSVFQFNRFDNFWDWQIGKAGLQLTAAITTMLLDRNQQVHRLRF